MVQSCVSQGAYSVWLVTQGLAASQGWRVGRRRLLTSAQLAQLYPTSLVQGLSSLKSALQGLALGDSGAALLSALALLQPGPGALRDREGVERGRAKILENIKSKASPGLGVGAERLVAAMQQVGLSLQHSIRLDDTPPQVGREHLAALQQYREDPLYSQVTPVTGKQM